MIQPNNEGRDERSAIDGLNRDSDIQCSGDSLGDLLFSQFSRFELSARFRFVQVDEARPDLREWHFVGA